MPDGMFVAGDNLLQSYWFVTLLDMVSVGSFDSSCCSRLAWLCIGRWVLTYLWFSLQSYVQFMCRYDAQGCGFMWYGLHLLTCSVFQFWLVSMYNDHGFMNWFNMCAFLWLCLASHSSTSVAYGLVGSAMHYIPDLVRIMVAACNIVKWFCIMLIL